MPKFPYRRNFSRRAREISKKVISREARVGVWVRDHPSEEPRRLLPQDARHFQSLSPMGSAYVFRQDKIRPLRGPGAFSAIRRRWNQMFLSPIERELKGDLEALKVARKHALKSRIKNARNLHLLLLAIQMEIKAACDVKESQLKEAEMKFHQLARFGSMSDSEIYAATERIAALREEFSKERKFLSTVEGCFYDMEMMDRNFMEMSTARERVILLTRQLEKATVPRKAKVLRKAILEQKLLKAISEYNLYTHEFRIFQQTGVVVSGRSERKIKADIRRVKKEKNELNQKLDDL